MNETKAKEVAAHLLSLGNTCDVQPVRVTIGSETFFGAIYKQNIPYEKGMDAVTRGIKKVGDPHYSRRFYLLGEVSKTYQKNTNVVFTYEGSDWYGGGGFTDFLLRPWNLTTRSKVYDPKFNPFGAWHDISLWSVPSGQSIDYYDAVKRRRVPMTVEFLDTSEA